VLSEQSCSTPTRSVMPCRVLCQAHIDGNQGFQEIWNGLDQGHHSRRQGAGNLSLLEDLDRSDRSDFGSEHDDFRDCDDFDFGSCLARAAILPNTFKFFFVKRARFEGVSIFVSTEAACLRF
jgi:hypothetical protein